MSDLSVELRPLTRGDLDLLEEARRSRDGAGALQWFGFRPTTHDRERFATDGLLGTESGALAIVERGELVGRVDWFASTWGPWATSACATIGIGVLEGARGRGVGRAAQQRLVDYLFHHTRYERVQAFTDVTNAAERRALEAVGFELEGVLRRGQWREGAWHDQALYSILRPSSD